ncbi:amidohydrolase [Caballeronia sp. ATUFL_M1_KS5A]|uniref:amidohydrolase n=1 Tax=Caballeronia sp. ATUFL_M1_KS5A TaxID=2921778 RepID=UPI0020280232|nr:amidohydrolase [Caballeronia sp. ATUFL_M1_KS5A]
MTMKHADSMKAEKIFHCAKILTIDEAQPQAEAVAVLGDRIVFVGTKEGAREWEDERTEWVDLGDAVLLPGFIEAHGHPYWSSQVWGDPVVDIRAVHTPTYAAALAKIRRRVEKAKRGEVLWFVGLDAQLHEGIVEPTRDLLDALSDQFPIIVQTSNLHAAYINSAAARHFSIDEHYQAPKGGKALLDAEGRVWKLLEMAVWELGERFYDMLGKTRNLTSFDDWLNKYARAGYTTSSEILLAPGSARAMARDMAALPARVRVMGYEAVAAGGEVSVPHRFSSGLFSMAGVKFHADGSVLLGNVWTSTPYLNNETTLSGMGLPRDNKGHALYDFETLHPKVERYASQGWQVSIHAHGDRTIDLVLDVYERVLGSLPSTNGPFRIEHCGLMRKDQIDRAVKLGVVCSFFLPYIYHWGEALRDALLGADVAEHFVPSGSATRAGMRVSYHCDSPMTWPDALKCLQVATTRCTLKGALIGAEERVSIDDALRAITIDAAYQLQAEADLGSISVGKLADFVALGADPRTWQVNNLINLPILGTYLGGQKVEIDHPNSDFVNP